MLTEVSGYIPKKGRNWRRETIAMKRLAIIETDLRREKKFRAQKRKMSKEEFKNMFLQERGLA